MISAIYSDADITDERENRDAYPYPDGSSSKSQFRSVLSRAICGRRESWIGFLIV